jgi:ABC-type antimicrobial peptide transport system permease subunit
MDALLLSAVSAETLDDVARDVLNLLEERHPVADGMEPPFRVISANEIAERAAASTRILTTFLVGVAAISLAVGGVGITNLMLVSVAQRTPEIGLRIAVGARSRDILTQFLGEGLLTSLFAGIAGIAVGAALTRAIAFAFDWPVHLSFGATAAAAASSTVGLLSAAYPSFRASRVDPIIALRSG